MGVIATAAKFLIAAGMSGDELVEALEKIEDAGAPSVTGRHLVTPGALRQRRYRERHEASQSVTVTSPVTSPVMCLDISKEEKEKTTAPRNAGDARRGKRLSDDWEPSQETCDWAFSEYGIDEEEGARLLDEFRDYWQAVPGAKGTKLDWDKTFKNRIRDIKARGKANGHQAKAADIYRPGDGKFRTSSGKYF